MARHGTAPHGTNLTITTSFGTARTDETASTQADAARSISWPLAKWAVISTMGIGVAEITGGEGGSENDE